MQQSREKAGARQAAQAAAAASGASTPLGAQAEALYALWDRLGNSGKDFSSMLELLRGEV